MPVFINGSTGISGTDGSAGTPAVQGTDTNTGVFFPAADTIAFAEGGVEAMRIDSSGNVGIGTSTPTPRDSGARTLEIYGDTRSAIKLTTAASGTAALDGLFIGMDNAQNASIVNSEAGVLQFGTSNAIRMTVDSSGRLSVPNQIAWHGFRTSSMSGTGTVSGYTPYLNVGSAFNATTGIFTAPVAGTYMVGFSCIGRTAGGTGGFDVFVQVNGVFDPKICSLRPISGSGTDTFSPLSSNTGLVYLNANDNIRMFSTEVLYSDANQWIRFYGYLLG